MVIKLELSVSFNRSKETQTAEKTYTKTREIPTIGIGFSFEIPSCYKGKPGNDFVVVTGIRAVDSADMLEVHLEDHCIDAEDFEIFDAEMKKQGWV